ncbi:uncharacterized protein TRIADDRAFT_27581 [Trichoplax adhaerens]|uniref:Ubiquitinyl hydrolase 1 n=1 Tax=Trichoplax adhaerens TaxID=10228 RepID=B3S0Y5_TRIAD|nr:hypothetical protein TRIADDRAFT_27581 [Trichoplax adhaerens]EDV23143.1 hypothetical protein TRIADDRAFT_27581 [Trichoplax adhaerens]|eukprot:XP_002114053.1 hypothetical protein TRIADDRAFT_27581 [Trichoplax adhaerens]
MVDKNPISKDRVLEWLKVKEVLSITLAGYLHQHQYCDKLTKILEFFGPNLPLDTLSVIWKAQIGKGSPTVDNIHNCLAAASIRFSSDQLDHLFNLIQQTWRTETNQNREKLLILIGKIGQEARVARIATKVLDLLWSLAHLPTSTADMVTQALKSHMAILSYSYLVKENIKQGYAIKCIDDIKKGVIHDLEKSHDVIKLITISLVKCHRAAVSASGGTGLDENTKIDSRYAYAEYLNSHLDLLSFILNCTNICLHWHRARDIWNCLESDPDACNLDRETCFDWFITHIGDLEDEAKSTIFNHLIQKLSPSKLTVKGFECFKTYFECINQNEHKLKCPVPFVSIVEKIDLTGISYLWQIVLQVSNEEVANEAINYFIQITCTNVSYKLKKDIGGLHKKFIAEFQKRLEDGIAILKQSKVAHAVSLTAAMVTAPAFPESAVKGSKRLSQAKVLSVERLLLLAEKYIVSAEESFPIHKRQFVPHGVSFHDHPMKLHVTCDSHKAEFTVEVFTNETLYSLRSKLASKLNYSIDHIQLIYQERLLNTTKDHKLLQHLGFTNEQHIKVRTYTATAAPPPYSNDDESCLPSVIISSNHDIFQKLYQLTELGEPNITDRMVSLIMLIPTDMSVLKALDSITKKNTSASIKNNNSSGTDKSDAISSSMAQFSNLFKYNASGMSAFRVRYNLEALSGKLMPVKSEERDSKTDIFTENFFNDYGLEMVTNVLKPESLPNDTEHTVRQGCYMLAVRITCFMLTGRIPPAVCTNIDDERGLVLHTDENKTQDTSLNQNEIEAAVAKNIIKVSLETICGPSRIEKFNHDLFKKIGINLIRIVKIVAAVKAKPGHLVLPTTSNLDNTQTEDVSERLQKSILNDFKDAMIAHEALAFLVMCLSQRFDFIKTFLGFADIDNLVLSALLESPNSQKLKHIDKAKLTIYYTYIGKSTEINLLYDALVNAIIKTRVPFWSTNAQLRGSNANLPEHCSQYFALRCKLLYKMSLSTQKRLKVDPKDMLLQETIWLGSTSLTDSTGEGPKRLLTGHLQLTKTLLTCEGLNKQTFGEKLIPNLIDNFLFPASNAMLQYKKNNNSVVESISPICTTSWTLLHTYDVLNVLATESIENLSNIVSRLIEMHHTADPELSKVWNYQPPIAPIADCGLVGLKNAGATCYMNSVIQQLYFQPGIAETVLSVDEETFKDSSDGNILYAMQLLFGHLMESKLQYYTPDHLWKNFKLWGRPINLHEQQDAFEFFVNLVDQMDEQLKQANCNQIFKETFCGNLTNQVVCKDCPHKYERVEQFWTLNLGVKCRTLQESLEQYVKGELLEGDNAYMCEKCQSKRNAIKRLCIKTLPPTLVVQLKRFDYDWEIGRPIKFDDYFEFPWVLNMEPYTLDGIISREKSPHVQEDDANSDTSSTDSNSLPSQRPKNYELAGVVVHSGQANAGHYYSFVKDRRTQIWYKMNDMTVEEFNMSAATLESECFGGSYQPKSNDAYPSYQDIRHANKYWSGYMLFYDAVTDYGNDKLMLSRSLDSRSEGARFTCTLYFRSDSSVPDSPSSLNLANDGFSQLAALVKRGERKGLFMNKMPASIQRIVHEENLHFMRNQSIYNSNYFKFILNLTSCNFSTNNMSSGLVVWSLKLAVNFLVNTYFKVREELRNCQLEWNNCMEKLITACDESCLWFLSYLSDGYGETCLKLLLLECPSDSVRESFAGMLQQAINRFYSCKRLEQAVSNMHSLLHVLARDVPDYYRSCSQYFGLLSAITKMRFAILRQNNLIIRLYLAIFKRISSGRRWSALQSREFSSIHITICNLIINCDVSTQHTIVHSIKLPDINNYPTELQPMSSAVNDIIFGIEGVKYFHEALLACCEVVGITASVTNMLVHCCWCNETFSTIVLAKLLAHLSMAPSNELKNLFTILTRLTLLDDSLKVKRFKTIVDGPENNGLLATIKSNYQTDSRRAYQCIKFLVSMANKDEILRKHLIENTNRWHWAVQWLKKKMSESWTSQSAVSNESSTSKVLQRTISAQDTLAEATALLSQIESSGIAHGAISELDSQDSLQEDSEVDELYNENGEKGGKNEDSADESSRQGYQF